MRWITPREILELQKSESSVLIVDIRETYETEICKITSLHIPMAEIKTRHSEIPKTGVVVVMCKSGKRAEATANLMESELGFEHLYILEGGILRWIAEIDTHLETY